ncbi:polyprenyl synthetase family protein [Streptomyces sp. NPDC006193]|uniref:polyprenyl synthetase family protein n=1 Tax=Streptomyces sp. NPDC006193 TaxID=3155717 RepID=UPI0033B46DF2
MRPTQAKEHHVAEPPPFPRLVPVPGPPAREHPDGATGGAGSGAAREALPPDAGDLRAVDADVPAAVGRVLDQVLADRLARARAADPLFAADLACRVADFTRAGGKRARAQLLWWSLRACGGGQESLAPALRIGAALELLQTCALVHDDVMDAAVRRRGGPALHAALRDRYAGSAPPGRLGRFGDAAGILAGDLALAWADDLVAETPVGPAAAPLVRRLWSDMRTEMVAGQYLDVQGQLTASYSLARALRAACLKSALYSVERPLALGAALAGADGATTRALRSAGRCVGVAFQLRDDLNDVFGDPRRTGRSCGSDIREGKPTSLIALALARAEAAGDRRALTVLHRSLGDAGLTPEGLDEVREVLVATGAPAAVEERIGRLVARGLAHLDGVPLAPEGRDPLLGLLRRTAQGAPPATRPYPPADGHPGTAPADGHPGTAPAEGRSGAAAAHGHSGTATAGEAGRAAEGAGRADDRIGAGAGPVVGRFAAAPAASAPVTSAAAAVVTAVSATASAGLEDGR